MNPSAKPWYPPGEVACGLHKGIPGQATEIKMATATVRWQNDPYRMKALRRPPTPLCADIDLSRIQVRSLSPPPQLPVKREPYRSRIAHPPAVGYPPDEARWGKSRRHSHLWAANGWHSEPTQLWRSFGTISSLESQGDSQDMDGMMLEEKQLSIQPRVTKRAMQIPLPRSQHGGDFSRAVPDGSHTTSTPAVSEDVHTIVPTVVSSTCDGDTCAFSTSAGDEGTADEVRASPAFVGTENGSCSLSGCEGKCDSEEANPNVCAIEKASPVRDRSSHSNLTSHKRMRRKVSREGKWIVVGGKAGTESSTQVATGKRSLVTSATKAQKATRTHSGDGAPREKAKAKQRRQPQKDDSDGALWAENTIVEARAKKNREPRRARKDGTDEELLDTLVKSAVSFAVVAPSGEDDAAPFVVMGVPLASITKEHRQSLLPECLQEVVRYQNALRLLLRSLTMPETSSAKMLLLQRALQGLPESCHHQCPMLVCTILLETSDCCIDVEKSLQLCHKALHISEKHGLETFEMLARLAITRTFARVVDTVDACANLTRAASIAIKRNEKPALGWIVMQMGVTLEILGLFPESLAWYEVAERIARTTGQLRLLCDIQCCQSITYSSVGEMELAHKAYSVSRELLVHIPRHRHQRPLQNYAQLHSQLGDMEGALRLQEEELVIAKELGDIYAVARCIGAIAMTRRHLGYYDEAAEGYMEEFSIHNTRDPRQAVESLVGAASCWRLSGHLQKARDYCVRALRQARECQDPTTLSKALIEFAEVELSMERVNEAQDLLCEALGVIARVDEVEQKQYLVKAALCEMQWRGYSALERVHLRRGEVFEALQCADRCHVPNTVNVEYLLIRHQRRAGVALGTQETELVSVSTVERLLKHPGMHGWRILCYSFPWNDGLDFVAYVVALDSDNGKLKCVGRQLRLNGEFLAFACASNALWKHLDAPMHTDTGERIYGDTPLWPQMYTKTAFDFQQDPNNVDRLASLNNDPHYCLRLLYDSLIRPLEVDIAGATGLMFVGDGILTRLPFHAFHNGDRYIAEDYCTSTCCSMALLCTHIMEEDAMECSRAAEAQKRETTEGVSEGPTAASTLSSTQRYTVIDDATEKETVMRAFLASTSQNEAPEKYIYVRHVVVDSSVKTAGSGAVVDTGISAAEGQADASDTKCVDEEVAATQQLLCSMQRRSGVTSVRNALYRAVHESPSGVLEIRLRAVPEVREDYCGFLVCASGDVVACHSCEVTGTWDLRGYKLVFCSGSGTYSGFSIHETGVPVYRALQYAGARQMLMATGSRIPLCDLVPTAAVRAVLQGKSVAAAIREAYQHAIRDDVALADWAGFLLVGLPF
ncbi:CHAT domain [Trypanosoma vivax]|uniref:CHAT domain-containing protein n=1 Tax=Trypanosoma vivax (strain Y486) TaxID=1055687 RepID=G0U3S5_TRYVY|nr:hypothetical protein TRVL_02273 [Trypanosoma vivax]KAH8614264.1 CHAT domain [Trypanosoma vivax]CCC50934.1 conserved hypothetical protein [Trypanosoma vivax Y486]